MFGNVGTLITGRVGYADADILRQEYCDTFSGQTFGDLNAYDVIVKTIDEASAKEPFRGRTLSPLQNRHRRTKNLTSHSRNRFSKPKAEVESKIARSLKPPRDR